MISKKNVIAILFLLILANAYAQDKPVGLKVGDQAPEINAFDHNGKRFILTEELEKGKMVVIFYRGSWCPHCNKHLSQLQDSINLITAKGASVITVTPEKAEFIDGTSEKFDNAFKIIEDDDLSIMTAYGVRYTLDEETVKRYKGYGLDFMVHNGDEGPQLPVPATYIIDQKGKISYVFFNEDYTQRASISTILKHL